MHRFQIRAVIMILVLFAAGSSWSAPTEPQILTAYRVGPRVRDAIIESLKPRNPARPSRGDLRDMNSHIKDVLVYARQLSWVFDPRSRDIEPRDQFLNVSLDFVSRFLTSPGQAEVVVDSLEISTDNRNKIFDLLLNGLMTGFFTEDHKIRSDDYILSRETAFKMADWLISTVQIEPGQNPEILFTPKQFQVLTIALKVFAEGPVIRALKQISESQSKGISGESCSRLSRRVLGDLLHAFKLLKKIETRVNQVKSKKLRWRKNNPPTSAEVQLLRNEFQPGDLQLYFSDFARRLTDLRGETSMISIINEHIIRMVPLFSPPCRAALKTRERDNDEGV